MNYTTVLNSAEDIFIEKKSKFIGAIAHVTTEAEANAFILERQKKFWDASHSTYGYVLKDGGIRRYSDAGEPQGTAGIPITEVILKSGITDVCIVVTRYFGGTLLGAGGLIRAYSHSASLAIASAEKTTLVPCTVLQMDIDYSQYGIISHIFPKYNHKVISSDFGVIVRMSIMLANEDLDSFKKSLEQSTSATVHPYEVETLYFDIKNQR